MRIPLLLILITSSLSVKSMYDNEYTYYQAHCSSIKAFSEHEKNDFFEMIYNKHLDPAQELARINEQFAYYKKTLHKEKNAKLVQLKNFHNIDDAVWHEGLKDIKNTKKEVTDYINTQLPDAEHDPIISGENKLFFAQHLRKYNLDIKKISIKKTDAVAVSYNTFFSMHRNKDNHTKATIVMNQPEIAISSLVFDQMKPTHQKAHLINLAWILGNISTTETALLYLILTNTCKNYDQGSLKNSKNYLSFVKLQEYKLSDMLPCLEDSQACQHLKSLRHVSYNSTNNKKNNEHFEQICLIKNLWEKRKMLEKLIQK